MEYIRNIAFFLIFVALLDNLFAFGNMKKYIKLFCGIIMIFIIMEPIGALLGSEIDFENMFDMSDIELRMEELSDEYISQDGSFTDEEVNSEAEERQEEIKIEKIESINVER